MIFDLSRRHWWNPTLEELCVQGLAWADSELEDYHEAWQKAYSSLGFKLLTGAEFEQCLSDSMPEYKIEPCDLSIFQHPRYQPDVSLGYDPWAPMRHWDD